MREVAFSILNEIYFGYFRNLENSIIAEIRTIIDNVYFSASSTENLVARIEKGWGKWSEKEEKHNFWKKVNDKLIEVKNDKSSKESNDKLKKRFRHFIMKIIDQPRNKTWIKSKEGKQKTNEYKEGKQKTNEYKGRKRKTKTAIF